MLTIFRISNYEYVGCGLLISVTIYQRYKSFTVQYTISNINVLIIINNNISNCTKIKHLSTKNLLFCILITLNAFGCFFLLFSYFFFVNVWFLSIEPGCSLVVNATCIPILNVKCLYRKYMRIIHFKRNFCFLFYKFALQLINGYLCKIRNEMQYRHIQTRNSFRELHFQIIDLFDMDDDDDDELEYGKSGRFMIVACISFAFHFPSTKKEFAHFLSSSGRAFDVNWVWFLAETKSTFQQFLSFSIKYDRQ